MVCEGNGLTTIIQLAEADKIMGKTDERIDAYIDKSADFARPILKHLRELVQRACPEVEETMEWSCPRFDYADYGILFRQ
jgi:hypothetical protein